MKSLKHTVEKNQHSRYVFRVRVGRFRVRQIQPFIQYVHFGVVEVLIGRGVVSVPDQRKNTTDAMRLERYTCNNTLENRSRRALYDDS